MPSSFFEPPPPPPPPPTPPTFPWEKPRAVLGAVAPVNFVLARTDEAAVCVWGITAFPNGFEFVVASMLRDRQSTRMMDIHHMQHRMLRHQGGDLPDELLRFGVVCADGSKATNLGGLPMRPDDPPERLLWEGGGGGTSDSHRQTYWCYPLPPPGPITFVCEWPHFGIPHTEHVIDAEPILEAAAKTKRVWDD